MSEHYSRVELPTAYSSEAETSDTSVASIIHHDLLNYQEPVTVWSPSTKSTLSLTVTVLLEICEQTVSLHTMAIAMVLYTRAANSLLNRGRSFRYKCGLSVIPRPTQL